MSVRPLILPLILAALFLTACPPREQPPTSSGRGHGGSDAGAHP